MENPFKTTKRTRTIELNSLIRQQDADDTDYVPNEGRKIHHVPPALLDEEVDPATDDINLQSLYDAIPSADMPVALLLAEGYSQEQIAEELGINRYAVRKSIEKMKKLVRL